MTKRQSDLDEVAFERSESRTFERNGKWYFATREGEFGPFATEGEATEDMEAYVALIDLREENERPVTPD